MRVHTVFAVKSGASSEVKERLENLLGLSFQLHESSYLGEYWRHEGTDGSLITVGLNQDPMYLPGDPEDEKYVEPEFASFGVLVCATVPIAREPKVTQACKLAGARTEVVRRTATEESQSPGNTNSMQGAEDHDA